jgi:hypothetical protein
MSSIDPPPHPRCVKNERTIRAPLAHAWSVLVDFPRYGEWNPFTFGVECDRVIGHPVTLRVNLAGRKITMHEWCTRHEEGRLVGWGVKWGKGIALDCDRVQALEAIDADTTRYVCYEAFDGLMAPIVYRFYAKQVLAGFDANADAFVKRCESTRP